MRSFGSDNYAGMHPAVISALAQANDGHARPYGDDPLSGRLGELMTVHFGPHARGFPALTGTAANVMALTALCQRWESVLCAETAHINTDECAAVEAMAGIKLVSVPHADGKISPQLLEPHVGDPAFEHRTRARVVSISQPTELGTLYTVEEIRALADFCHGRNLALHVDGARLANAAAALGLGLGDITTAAGVDVLSLGGTKNGLLAAEAVVFLSPGAMNPDYGRIRKQCMQLPSKMRFLNAQLVAYLEDGLWLDNARHANAMARLLATKVEGLPGVCVSRPVETNAVFARVAPQLLRVREVYPFYVWSAPEEPGGWPEVRWMTSFDTTHGDVDGFVAELARQGAAA